jgi:dTDP-4-dehydrorhamnose 3,5-epimerase-like enzyme
MKKTETTYIITFEFEGKKASYVGVWNDLRVQRPTFAEWMIDKIKEANKEFGADPAIVHSNVIQS